MHGVTPSHESECTTQSPPSGGAKCRVEVYLLGHIQGKKTRISGTTVVQSYFENTSVPANAIIMETNVLNPKCADELWPKSCFWRCDFHKYIGFTIDNLNSKMLWVRLLRPIYFILCGDLTATVSHNSTAVHL